MTGEWKAALDARIRRTVRPALLALALLLLALPASAHIGGIPVRPVFQTPAGIVVAEDETFELRWWDDDRDPTGVFVFFHQRGNAPPATYPPHDLLDGTAFGEAAIQDPEDRLVWDLTDVPSGAWHVWAKTDDPPFCLATFAEGVVVVHREGEPVPLGAYVTRPPARGELFDQAAVVEVTAIAPAAPTLTVRAGRYGADLVGGDGSLITDCDEATGQGNRVLELIHDVAVDVAMVPDPARGADRWIAEIAWDTSEVRPGDYVIEATVREGEAETVVYGLGYLTVYHRQRQQDPPDEEEEESPILDEPPDGTEPGGCGGRSAAAAAVPVLLLGLFGPRRFRNPHPGQRRRTPR
jgi:hypothetical protein